MTKSIKRSIISVRVMKGNLKYEILGTKENVAE